jgi:hypothetical protein
LKRERLRLPINIRPPKRQVFTRPRAGVEGHGKKRSLVAPLGGGQNGVYLFDGLNAFVSTAPYVLAGGIVRTPAPAAPFRQTHASSVSYVSSQQNQTQTQTHASSNFNPEGLRLLREILRDIAFHLPNQSFKVDVRGNAVWIRLMRSVSGTQQTEATAKAKLDILNRNTPHWDAGTVPGV